MNEEHSHSFHLRGVCNFSTMISICFIFNITFLYLRDKQQLLDEEPNDHHRLHSEGSNELPLRVSIDSTSSTIANRNFINANNHFLG